MAMVGEVPLSAKSLANKKVENVTTYNDAKNLVLMRSTSSLFEIILSLYPCSPMKKEEFSRDISITMKLKFLPEGWFS